MTQLQFKQTFEPFCREFKQNLQTERIQTYYKHLCVHELWELEEAIYSWKLKSRGYFPSPEELKDLCQTAFSDQVKNTGLTTEDIQKAPANTRFCESCRNLLSLFFKKKITSKEMLEKLDNLIEFNNITFEEKKYKSLYEILEKYNFYEDDIYRTLTNKKGHKGEMTLLFKELYNNKIVLYGLNHKNRKPIFRSVEMPEI